jgi:Putative Actinobacterial Holin-X, holin superfamily III
MPTRETEANAGVGPAAKQVAEHASALARLELELAALELKKKAATFGAGIGLGLGGALFAVFMLGFTFATIAAGLATAVSTWLALLITTGILLVLTALLAGVGVLLIRKSTPPVPEQAIEEARRTTEALKRNGRT